MCVTPGGMGHHIMQCKNDTMQEFVCFKDLNSALADQRAEVYFIFHKAQLRCEKCFIE